MKKHIFFSFALLLISFKPAFTDDIPKKQIKAVVFDYHEVMGSFDLNRFWEMFNAAIQNELDVPEEHLYGWKKLFTQIHKENKEDKFWERRFQGDNERKENFLSAMLAIKDTCSLKNEGMFALVEKLKANGYTVAVFANMSAAVANTLKQLERLSSFDHNILSCDHRSSKPLEGFYQKLLSELNQHSDCPISPDEILVIERYESFANACKTHGFEGIEFSNIDTLIHTLENDYGVRCD